uniref:Apyrase n=1 Tax=Timema shepardi TaxID=629360 RepID=A0A7R9AU83_TIMSH|nr:unnamed protein product [Timema shepardi]
MSYNIDDNEMIMSLREWRSAVRTPTTFRVGNSTLRIQTKFVSMVAVIGLLILCFFFIYGTPYRYKSSYHNMDDNDVPYHKRLKEPPVQNITPSTSRGTYNSTYPLTPPVTTKVGIKYRIGIVSDMDHSSKSKTEDFTWISYLLRGYVVWNPVSNSVNVFWDDTKPVILKSSLGESGRGMELSEMIVFNGKLYAVDDRTGMLFEIDNNGVIPWVVLQDGNGRVAKGFKCEWAAVKQQKLYVGGLGKEWTNHEGDTLNLHPLWVKTITATGEVNHLNWHDNYLSLRSAIGIEFPGYMSHEAGVWSDVHNRWFFLPRRCSKERYNPDLDEKRSCNVLLTADEDFNNIKVTYVGEITPTHGFSSFRFVPGTSDRIIVALKSVEDAGLTATYIMAFDITGKIILEETKVADFKYEGLEFI